MKKKISQIILHEFKKMQNFMLISNKVDMALKMFLEKVIDKFVCEF
jgi:hypothetical protein